MTMIDIRAHDGGTFQAYLAKPDRASAPGVLVIQEIFGLNANIRRVCDDLAAAGYMALAPDLFWRQKPGVQLTDKSEAEWAEALAYMNGFDWDKGMKDLLESLGVLRGLPGATGKAGTVGFCMGGQLAYLMATRSTADCNVGYYGVALEKRLNEAPAITKPLMLHIAGQDKYCPPEARAQIEAVLGRNPLVEIHLYPDSDHAFARHDGIHENKADKAAANERTMAFLAKNLR